MNVREAAALAAHVVAKGGTLPILGYLRISNGRIVASDLSQQIDIPLVLPDGVAKSDFCVHAERFMRALSALPSELEVDLQLKGKRLTITAGRTKYELNTLPPEDYPTMGGGDKAVEFKAPSKAFVSELRGSRLTLTATDGHRLHRSRLEVDAKVNDTAAGIIAAPSVARLVEIAGRHTDITVAASRTRFDIDDKEVLWTKLIDGNFPETERVIPADRPSTGGIATSPTAAAARS